MMGRLLMCLSLSLLGSSVSGCDPEIEEVLAATQLTLSVDSDPGLRAQADALHAQLWVKEPTRWRKGRAATIPTAGLPWPIEIPILPKSRADESADIEVQLELLKEGQRLAQRRVVAKFVAGRVLTVTTVISSCSNTGLMCDDESCHGATCTQCSAGGSCTPTGYTSTFEPEQRDGGTVGIEMGADAAAPSVPAADAGSSKVDAQPAAVSPEGGEPLDAQTRERDSAVLTDAFAASDPNDAATPLPMCPTQNSCSALYPCLATKAGYTCRGQRADWPMPDGVAGAKFAQSYSSLGESVLDNVTKLEWQIAIPRTYPGCTGRTQAAGGVLGDFGGLCTRDEGKRYCEQLTRAGHDDWRLPSLIELVSLFDMREDTDWSVAVNGDFFGDTDLHVFVGDSTSSSGATSTWTVSYEYRTIFLDRNVAAKVRCVRAGSEPTFAAPADRYTIGSDTVTDRATELVWQRSFSPAKLAPSASDGYCTGLGGGFRVPTPNELLTLVDPTRANPAIDTTAFPNTPSAEFATSSKSVVPNHVTFATGELIRQEVDAHVRCVR